MSLTIPVPTSMPWPRFTIGTCKNIEIFRQKSGRFFLSSTFSPDQTVLEIGTGTGEFALAAALHCAKVYAVDLSEGMLKYAEKKARSRGVKNVEFLQGGFLTYQHPTPVDAVVTQLALHHLPDFWKQVALMRMADMLRDGGKLCLRDVVFNFDIRDYEDSIESYVSRASEIMGDEFAGRIAAHVKNEYSTIDWIMEGMIERAGFKVVRKELQGWIYRRLFLH